MRRRWGWRVGSLSPFMVACNGLTCGPGTHEVAGACQVLQPAEKAGSDASIDAGQPDAGGSDIAVSTHQDGSSLELTETAPQEVPCPIGQERTYALSVISCLPPEIFADGSTAPLEAAPELAVTVRDVYWAKRGLLWRAARAGGEAELVLDRPHRVDGLEGHGSYLAWKEWDHERAQHWIAVMDVNNQQLIRFDANASFDLLLDGSGVWWMEGPSVRMARFTELFSATPVSNSLQRSVGGSETSEDRAGNVEAVDIGGPFGEEVVEAWAFTVANRAVYFVYDDEVFEYLVPQDERTALAALPAGTRVLDMAANDENLYLLSWTSVGVGGAVWQVPFIGGEAERLIDLDHLSLDLTVYSNEIFWFSFGVARGPSFVFEMWQDGRGLQVRDVIDGGSLVGLGLAGNDLYWSSNGQILHEQL